MQEFRENYYALLLAVTSPVSITVQEAFDILNGIKTLPECKTITERLLRSIPPKGDLTVEDFERQYHINYHEYKEAVKKYKIKKGLRKIG